MNKARKKQRSIRQKLVAAIAMLMVSAIMVVSSSYAWFTLSTAPEVTGIQTSIGANGNLEMALNNGGEIGTTTTSTDDWTVKNLTWGNLVDLNNGYGLDLVQLLPSRLDYANGVLAQNLLEVPTYGADGRVNGMKDVIQGIYNGSPAVPNVEGNGVRLFGTAADMSDEELALRAAKMNFSVYMSAAKGKAVNTLTANGATLAEMAIEFGMNGDTATFSRTQVEALYNVVGALEEAANDIETALKYAVKAAAATQAGGHLFSIENQTLEQLIAALPAGANNTYLDTYVTKLNELKDAVDTAMGIMETALVDDDKSEFVWTEFSAAINALMNSSAIKVNGLSVSEIQAEPGEFASAVMGTGNIAMVVSSGAGVFADIADFTGDYTTPTITIPEITYSLGGGSPIKLTNLPTTMTADTDMKTDDDPPVEIPAYSVTITAAMNSFAAPGGTGTASLSDFYAYAIDLAFRTNAADSNLLLQTTATDRIYEGNTNENTQGGGSYMEFTVATGFPLETAKKLMACIRVVFMSTTDGSASESPTIYKVAVLDVDNLETTASGTVKVPLKIAEYTVTNNELVITTEDGKPVFATNDEDEYDATIMSLNQNEEQYLTALVYLDGNNVDNSMVANGDFSLTGKMNLQFASSAELKPMEYSDLHIPGGNNN